MGIQYSRKRGRPPFPGTLTPAEQRVLEGVRLGLRNGEISDRLTVGVETVRYHLANIRGKLGIEDRAELAAWREPEPAPRSGWIAWFGVHAARFAVTVVVFALAAVGIAVLTRGRPHADRPAPSATDAPAVTEWETSIDPPGLYRGDLAAVGPDGSLYLAVGAGAAGGRGLASYPDVLLVRVGPGGTVGWQTTWHVDGVLRPRALAVAPDGSVYLAGATSGHPDNQPNAGGFDAVVAKINPDGQIAWARTAGTEGYDTFAAVSLLDNGQVLVGGGSGTVQGFVGPRTVAMVRQFDAAGQPVDTADPALPLLVTQIAGLEGVGYVAAGERNSDRDYRQGDAALFRADASGRVAWRADYTNALVARLAVVEGVVYVVGQTGIIEFDGEPVAGAQDVFADGYQLDGARLWRHSISSSERDIPQSLVPAPGGVEVLVRLGQVPGGLEFDTCPCPVAAPGAYGDIDGVFTLVLDRDGNATALDPAADGVNVLGPSGEHYGVTLVLDAGMNQARHLTRIQVTRFR